MPKGRRWNPREAGGGASNVTRGQGIPIRDRQRLMEAVVKHEGMTATWKVDGMTVYALLPYLRQHWPRIKEELLSGRYVLQPMHGVEIPKSGDRGVNWISRRPWIGSSSRPQSGTVPYLRSRFFRIQRRLSPWPRHAIGRLAGEGPRSLRRFVVDMGMERRPPTNDRSTSSDRGYFDVRVSRGYAAGRPPLAAFVHPLDKELERRGHAFCHYADDCNIYMQTGRRANARVMVSLAQFLADRLNKSAADRPWKRKFLGYSMTF